MPHPVQVDRETCSHLLLGKELQVIWVPDVPLSHSLILASRRQRGAPDHRVGVTLASVAGSDQLEAIATIHPQLAGEETHEPTRSASP